MILHIVYLVLLSVPCVLTYDRSRLFRNRRMLLLQPHHRRNVPVPFVIRVPYSKVVPSNPLFSHSVAWKAKLAQVKSNDEQESSPQQQQPDPEITQFHSQDTNGQVVFGFNSPDQMRIETRNSDGTVHGTYSYLDPYGQIIKRQYWDTGAGFHVTSNTYPVSNVPGGQAPQPEAQYTPEVQAARDLHFQLYQQALASLLPHHGSHDVSQENSTTDTAISAAPINQTILPAEEIKANDTKPTSQDRVQVESESDSQGDGSENAVEPSTQNGSIVIENPEYLRISWTTENKKYRLNLYNGTDNSTNKVHIRQEIPNSYNITKFSIQGSQ